MAWSGGGSYAAWLWQQQYKTYQEAYRQGAAGKGAAGKGAYAPTKRPGPVPGAAARGSAAAPARADNPLPFGVRTRGAAETQMRNLHRRYLPDDLLRVHAHWVDIPVGEPAMLRRHLATEQDSTGTLPPAPVEAEGAVDARALIVAGVSGANPAMHIIQRVELVVARVAAPPPARAAAAAGTRDSPVEVPAGGRARLEAYGGRCAAAAGDDAAAAAALAQAVRAQGGVDLTGARWVKLVEFEYSGGRRTVFYMPEGFEGPLRLRCQAEDEEEEYDVEERVLDEAADAAAAAEWEAGRAQRDAERAQRRAEAEAAAALQGGDAVEAAEEVEEERKPVMKVVVEKRTRLRKRKVVQPMKIPLGNLVDYAVGAQMHRSTVELAMAADALDEYLKREMASRVVAFLEAACVRKKEETSLEDKRKVKAEERKRKWDEEDQARKKRRATKEAEVRAGWKKEDADQDGMTEDEKREALKARREFMVNLWKEDDAQLREQRAAEARADAAEPGEDGGKRYKTVIEQDTDAFHGFQYFDRPRELRMPTGHVPRGKLEAAVHCLSPPRAGRAVAALFDAVPATPQVAYAALCSVRRRRELADGAPDEPSRTPEKTARAKPAPAAGSAAPGRPAAAPGIAEEED